MTTATWRQSPGTLDVVHGATEDVQIVIQFADDITGWTFTATRGDEPVTLAASGHQVTLTATHTQAAAWLAAIPVDRWVLRRTGPQARDLLVGRWTVEDRG